MGEQVEENPRLDERSINVLLAIQNGLNGQAGADFIASQLGYRPARSGRLAVTGTLRKLERQNIVGRLPPRDQWGHAVWFLMPKGKASLTALSNQGSTKHQVENDR